MKLLKIIGNLFGRGIFRRNRLKLLREKRQTDRFWRDKAKKAEAARVIKMIRKFPEKQMTAADFALLKRGKDIDLHTCPIGTWFVCKPSEHLPDITVVGQVVEPEKMFENQWGAGMSLPLRGINRYVLDLV